MEKEGKVDIWSILVASILIFVVYAMMVLGDGLLRTKDEFGVLFDKAGLKVNRILPTRLRFSIVEGAPVQIKVSGPASPPSERN